MRKITETYFVAPQIDPADMSAAVDAGVTTIIANRPDGEVPPSHQQAAIRSAAEAAGLTFVELPVTHQTMTAEIVSKQAEAIANAEGNVLAYCASGTRSTIVWALGMAMTQQMPIDEIIAAAAQGGYDLSNARPMLEQVGGQ